MAVEGLEPTRAARPVVWVAAPERAPSACRLALRLLLRSFLDLLGAALVVALTIGVPVLSSVVVCLGTGPRVPLWLPP